jgi:hypothetical protein
VHDHLQLEVDDTQHVNCAGRQNDDRPCTVQYVVLDNRPNGNKTNIYKTTNMHIENQYRNKIIRVSFSMLRKKTRVKREKK